MRFKNRKTPVLVLLGFILVVQIVFSGIRRSDDSSQTQNAVVVAENETTEESTSSEKKIPITEEEVVSADLNVVYRSDLTSTEVVDEFESSIDNGDYDNKIVSYTNEKLCVYSKPNLKSSVVGIMYSGTEGNIIKKGAVWTQIKSGKITGYVRNTDVLFGEEAQIMAESIGNRVAIANTDALCVYSEEDAHSDILTSFKKGTKLKVCESNSKWTLVSTSKGYGYVRNQDVAYNYGLGKAITISEEKERQAEEAKRAAEEAAKRAEESAESKYSSTSSTNRGAFSLSAEELHLLATIVYYEAGWEPAEGQLAVANVVLNRMVSSEFRQNTIAEVIYAPGQFSGVAENGGPSARFRNEYLCLSNEELNYRGCYDVALQAAAGVNNIGDYMFFIGADHANYGRYTNYTIINNHCFYKY